MTLEEDEAADTALWAPPAECETSAPAKTKTQSVPVRWARIAAVIPIVLLLLPVYALIKVCAAAVCVPRMIRRKMHRHCFDVSRIIPDVCGASHNLEPR